MKRYEKLTEPKPILATFEELHLCSQNCPHGSILEEFVLSNQVLRSGTAIGALIRESEFAQSKADFIHKLSIALKEANETDYWLNILKDTDYIDKHAFDSMEADCGELMALLVASIKTLKKQQNEE